MAPPVSTHTAAASRVDGASLTQPLYGVCTADEEIGYGGARAVSERSQLYADLVAAPDMHAIIGEPTLVETVYADKGGIAFSAIARGESAHTSTAEGSNAMWKLVQFLSEVDELRKETETADWQDDEFTPPLVNLTISVSDDQPALNVKAAYAECRGSFRPSPRTDTDRLMRKIADAAALAEAASRRRSIVSCSFPSTATPARKTGAPSPRPPCHTRGITETCLLYTSPSPRD